MVKSSTKGIKMKSEITICGYYGFDNLGDEAILEAIVARLHELGFKDHIVVLSNNPQETARRYGVKAIDRWNLSAIARAMFKTKLFISGGGGLFQDATSINSVVYYGAMIALAKLAGAKICVYGQGLGPLRSPASQMITRSSMNMADLLTVRDDDSKKMLADWHIPATKTADPVLNLPPTRLPSSVLEAWKKSLEGKRSDLLIGLSLRTLSSSDTSNGLDDQDLDNLVKSLKQAHGKEKDSTIVLLPLQAEQDRPILQRFETAWQAAGGNCVWAPLDQNAKPSEWLSFIGTLDLVVGMRLHSLIMALKNNVPTFGLAYDPKVIHTLALFGEPYADLRLARDFGSWQQALQRQIKERKSRKQALAKAVKDVRIAEFGNAIVLETLSGAKFALLEEGEKKETSDANRQ